MKAQLAAIALLAGANGASAALNFTRDGQKALIPYQKELDWVGELTLEVWICPNSTAPERFFNYVISRNYGNQGYGLCIQGHQTKHPNLGTTNIPLGQWTHIAVVCGKRAEKLYVNGELADVLPGDARTRAIGLPMYIGNSNFSATPGDQPTGFRGEIAEVRIWNVALDQRQVQRTMNRFLTGHERHLLAYYPLTEGSGTLVHDFTGHTLAGHLGDDYTADADDPDWTDGPRLRGRGPRLSG